MERATHWKYTTEGAMAGVSTEPDTVVLEVNEEYGANPEKLIEKI